MGKITIKTEGSFGISESTYSAEEGGHAYALQRGMFFILQKMAGAIKLDHKLHGEGDTPPISDYGCKKPK
jgi:hypothetical protein